MCSGQGLLFANAECCKTPVDMVRLYIHEAHRVYRDKLVDNSDVEMFDKVTKETIKKAFDDVDENAVFQQPLMYCHFAQGIGDPKYMPINVYAEVNKLLVDALENHNEFNAAMNLVLFEVRREVVERGRRDTSACGADVEWRFEEEEKSGRKRCSMHS